MEIDKNVLRKIGPMQQMGVSPNFNPRIPWIYTMSKFDNAKALATDIQRTGSI